MAKIIVPTSGTVISSAWGKSVADTLNAALVQAGHGSGTTDASGYVGVTFPTAFQSAPIVVANHDGFGGSAQIVVAIVSVSATAAIFRFSAGAGNIGAGFGVSFDWIAVGPRA